MRLRKETEAINDDEILLLSQVSDALAHPARIKIFRHIMKCNVHRTLICNKDLVNTFDYSQATISQHIKKLIDSGLIVGKRDHKYTYFYANVGMVQKYTDIVKKFD